MDKGCTEQGGHDRLRCKRGGLSRVGMTYHDVYERPEWGGVLHLDVYEGPEQGLA